MPISIKNLVSQSPVKWSDGTVFLGRKTTEFYVLDLETGRVTYRFADFEQAPSAERLAELYEHMACASADARSIFLGRTEYHLTAYRPDAPPRKTSFAEFSGIRDPKILWRRTEDGQLVEFEPNLAHLRQLESQQVLSDQLLYSSLDGLLYSRSRKTGKLLWARPFAQPAVNVLRLCQASQTEMVVFDDSSLMALELVHVPIQPVVSGEFPDAEGKISHPLDPGQAPGKPHEELNDLVNIGEHAGVLYVLPQSRFPRFRSPAKQDAKRPGTGEMGLVKRLDYLESLWQQTCFPSDANWPYCLLGSPQVVYEPSPRPLLLPGALDGSAALRVLWSLLLGLLLAVTGFFGRKFWRHLRRRPVPVPQPRLLRRPAESSASTRPPGFEEITLTSADYFYQVQGYNEDYPDSAPKSFIVTDQVLGYGSHGTVVFKGQFDGRDVAVKRMLIDFFDVAGHEVSLLQQSDSHPNVIRYFCREQTDRFMYIVLELCPASLADVIEKRDTSAIRELFPPERPLDPKRVLQEIMLGLEHLHASKLVHRDLKPANILVAANRRMLLSDFGLSKKLADDQSSFHATVMSGTIGWRAPECILSDEVAKLAGTQEGADTEDGVDIGGIKLPKGIKITKAIDLFASGCVFYYVLTGGRHPFGNRMQREMNIVQNTVDLSGLDHDPVAQDLVGRMISREAAKRPAASQVLVHPFFWEPSKRLSFLLDVSDFLERESRREHPTNRALEQCRSKIYNGKPDWSSVVEPIFWEDLSKFRKYFGNSVQDLLRAMRNKRHHFQELAPELRALLGESAENYIAYFERHFPNLLIQVYYVLEKAEWRQAHPFKDVYFADVP